MSANMLTELQCLLVMASYTYRTLLYYCQQVLLGQLNQHAQLCCSPPQLLLRSPCVHLSMCCAGFGDEVWPVAALS
jgi:hypothetical protein